MSENTIICPKCGTNINLDEISKAKYNEDLKKNEEKLKEDFAKREEEIKKEMWIKALKVAEEKQQEEIKKRELETMDLKNRLGEAEKKQQESIKQELELRKKTRELEEKSKNQEIENARKLDEERKKMAEEIEKNQAKLMEEKLLIIQEDHRKKELEKDKQMDNLKKSLEEANRKAMQGSQQIQGEILENELKIILISKFPIDIIEDIATGKRGADVVQKVRNNYGHESGVIVWEAKNTKHWTESWVVKLKEDRLRVGAVVSIIVTTDLPEGIKYFGFYKDIYVTDWEHIEVLTQILREQIISMDKLKNSLVGKDEKMEVIYNYLTSTEFRDKIQNVVEAFSTMKNDLEKEKRAMEKIWSAREKQLDRVMLNTTRLYGDMEGLIGSKLQKIDYLELETENAE
ncbi:MAG: DUF2130 domain-containing protein [Candidatus Gracilibacteria bacterium]|nr:DUF2130 domain-containing protein [Candidatus Gracilibacteria bacterium]